MSSSDQPICSNCIHAALDSSGVYCKLFHEAIFDERVAAECGEYDPEVWPEPAAVDRPALVVLNGDGVSQRERSVSCRVDVGFYGRSDHGEKILKNLERELALHLGDKVRVTRL